MKHTLDVKRTFFLVIALLGYIMSQADPLSPEDFLGYPLGSRFTPHHRIINYLAHVKLSSDRVHLENYGQSVEGRPLMAAFISSPSNIDRLQNIRLNNRRRAGLEPGSPDQDIPAIVWLSYGIHGNESVSSEVALQVIYHLTLEQEEVNGWLEKLVVVIDPCLNPDGRSRYVDWYQQLGPSNINPNPDHWNHQEPWPGGRGNHFLFDLNRDWVWQIQPESKQRLKLYNQWLPQVHVDFHEQGVNEPYYFAPAAEPFHQLITSWQRDFQHIIGSAQAAQFDANKWLYFTREKFDLLYPGFGDTYPLFNGAIGMTYEQGGSGRAGLAVKSETGDTLTLLDRFAHHLVTSLKTLEVSSNYQDQLVSQFTRYFETASSNPEGEYKAYILKQSAPAKMQELTNLLDLLEIEYFYSNEKKSVQAFSYQQNRRIDAEVNPGDLVIQTAQPKSVLLQVLLDPAPVLSDSNSYDITSWALPYVFGLKGLALKENNLVNLDGSPNNVKSIPEKVFSEQNYAYIIPWHSFESAKALSYLVKRAIKTRALNETVTVDDRKFEPGSILITKADNRNRNELWQIMEFVDRQYEVELEILNSGWTQSGPDLGSNDNHLMHSPDVLLVGGPGTDSKNMGEIWYYFEKQLQYPHTITYAEDFNKVKLDQYNVLIFPSAHLDLFSNDHSGKKIRNWVEAGNKLILFENSVEEWMHNCDCDLERKSFNPEEKDSIINAQSQEYNKKLEGSILKVALDRHSLGFGLGEKYFTMRTNEIYFQRLKGGKNVAVIDKNSFVSGLAGEMARLQMKDALLFGVENIGEGSCYYLVDNPLFRGFWQDGLLLFANALFFENHKND